MNKALSAADAVMLASYLTGSNVPEVDKALEKCQTPSTTADDASRLAAWLTEAA
jgi:hypothetical protein